MINSVKEDQGFLNYVDSVVAGHRNFNGPTADTSTFKSFRFHSGRDVVGAYRLPSREAADAAVSQIRREVRPSFSFEEI